ncbi:MAG: methyltransferase domain-containing protein [Aestuariibacter sp.]
MNSHERPDLKGTSESVLNKKIRHLTGLCAKFEHGYVKDITVPDDDVLNYFRLLHHNERYQFAASHIGGGSCEEMCLLDIGIGLGQGACEFVQTCLQLYSVAPAITGLEVEHSVAESCRNINPDFSVLEDNILSFESDKSFDFIICFELLGNKSLKSDALLLSKIRQLLKKGGKAFISIATFANSPEGTAKKKDYSARIYSQQSFETLIKESFLDANIEFFGQSYPLKRMSKAQVGVRPLGNGFESDFGIAVVTL